jgi:hypothetical protein
MKTKRICHRFAALTLVIVCLIQMLSTKLRRTLNARRYFKKMFKRRTESNSEVILPYNQDDIVALSWGLNGGHSILLAFDGNNFKAYLFGHNNMSWRYVSTISLIIHALESNFPNRFQPDQPVFQMVFTVSDFLDPTCALPYHVCPESEFYAPFVSFSSLYRKKNVFPTAKAFPNTMYIDCIVIWLRDSTGCRWKTVDQTLKFEELQNKLIWRGSDFYFLPGFFDQHRNNHQMLSVFSKESLVTLSDAEILEELMKRYLQITPRWKAVVLSLKERLSNNSHSWIDALFTGSTNEETHNILNDRGIIVSDKNSMHSIMMSKFKYQIDLGGGKSHQYYYCHQGLSMLYSLILYIIGGGTTWEGTLTKLLMPGLLFHHETPTKDWFYDFMEPYVHYIPVDLELNNLRSQYEWALANPDKVKTIAENSTKFAEYLLSAEYIEKLYKELFVDFFGQLIQAYQPQARPWKKCLELYKQMGLELRQIAHCDNESCFVEWNHGIFEQISKRV